MRRNKMPEQPVVSNPAVAWWLEVDPVTSQLTRVYRDFPTLGQAVGFAKDKGGVRFGLVREFQWHHSHHDPKSNLLSVTKA